MRRDRYLIGDDEPGADAGPSAARVSAARLPISGGSLTVFVALALILCGGIAAGLWHVFSPPAERLPPAGTVSITLEPPAVPEQRVLDIAPENARALNERVPFATDAAVAAQPFVFAGSPDSLARATDCLAAAAWYEAGDGDEGQRAVAQVIVNRALNPAFPASICRVVFQGSDRPTGCQFTFTCDGSMMRTPSAASWLRSRRIAAAALAGLVYGPVGYATHYHTDWVVPYWRDTLDKIARVGTHLFYRWRGYWGTPAAFTARRNLVRDEPIVPRLARLSAAHAAKDGEMLVLPDLQAAAANETVAAAAPPIAVDGVAATALRGSLVRGRPDDGRFLLQLLPTSLSGGYATTALALCKGRAQCRVFGWSDPAAIPAKLPMTAAEADKLIFAYVRTDADSDRALWNCANVERANKAQCLPADADARMKLAGQ